MHKRTFMPRRRRQDQRTRLADKTDKQGLYEVAFTPYKWEKFAKVSFGFRFVTINKIPAFGVK